ncbi:histidinol-phosphatase HisJ family protein [Cetobacterium sp.]|uniref:histidinol-phosphatase HisJ family protein n=1 Tax=Cetobacterium sp. TaxID=2071632 RepID=UPI003F30F8D7
MIISDYHIHSSFSGDSVEDLDRICRKAKELGIKEIAITDHMDLDVIGTTNSNDFMLNLDEYVPTILKLKDQYKDDLDIKLGMEFGIQRHLGEVGDKIIEKYPFDFIISSVHSVDKLLLDQKEFWENKTREQAHDKYFLEILKSVENFNGFSVQGHLDFITRYGGIDKKGFIDYIRYQDIIDEILKKIISKGKGIEINTSGIRYNENRFYPCDDIIKRYFKLGGEILTIGSDSHKTSDLGKDFKKAYDFLESIGVKYISSFDQLDVSFKKIK